MKLKSGANAEGFAKMRGVWSVTSWTPLPRARESRSLLKSSLLPRGL